MITIDIRETPSARAADIALIIKPGQRLRARHDDARADEGPAGRRGAGRRDRPVARHDQGPRRPDEAGQVRRHFLRHGSVDDPRQAHELRRHSEHRRGDERVHQVRVHADARPRQRDRRRRRAPVDDRLSLRRQLEPRLSAVQSRRVLDGRSAGARRQRRDAGARRGSGRDDAAAGDRTLEENADDRARSQGDAHQPAGPRALHDGGDRCQRRGNGLPDGRDSDHAAAGTEIAISYRRGDRQPDHRRRRPEARMAPAAPARADDASASARAPPSRRIQPVDYASPRVPTPW